MKGEKQKSILLVEDEAIIAMSEKMTLERFGYNVTIAGSGEAAVEIVEKNPDIDLILMDIDLGAGMDGTEAAAIILQQRDLPVVFLSGHTEPEIIARTEKITSYGFLVKNSSETVFQALIKMVFKLFESTSKEKRRISQGGDALEALYESEERYRSIINTSPDGILISDMNGRIIMVSPAILNIFAFERQEELLGLPFSDFIIPADRERAAANVALMLQGTMTGPGAYHGVRANGDIVDIEVNADFIRDAEGKPTRMVFIVRDTGERKRMEEKLRESEERMRAIVEGTPHLFFYVQDAKANNIYVSPTIASITGYDAGTWLKRKDWFITDAPMNQQARDATRAHLRGEFTDKPVLLEIRHARGHAILLEAYEYPIVKNGSITGLQGVAHDISERRRTEAHREAALQELQEAKALTDAIVENVPLMIFLKEATDLKFVVFNRAGEELLGYERQALLGKNDLDFFPTEQAAHFMAKDREVLEGEAGMLDIPEEPILTARKGTRLLHTRKVSIRGADGKSKYLLGISEDITERKRAEKELQENNSRLELAMQAADMAWWEMDLPSGHVSFEIRKAEMLGYPAEKFKHFQDFMALVHPDDREKAMNAMRGHLDGSLPRYEVEYRIAASSGEYIWFHDIGSVGDRDAHGKPLNVTGLVINIGGRKKAEAEIQRQLTEKELLLKEVHHRIKNNIASIGGLLSLHMQASTSPEAVAALQDAIGRVDSMRLLYEKLLLGGDFRDASVKNYIESLATSVISLFPDLARVKLNLDVDDFKLEPKKLFPLGIIINELLTNIIKHAFAGKKSGTIQLSLARDGARVTLALQDDGIGLPSGFDTGASRGFGLTLVKMLSQQLGGSFSIEKHKGTRCTVIFDV